MVDLRPAGPYPIPNATIPTWLVRFDENGVCVSPQTEAALLKFIEVPAKKDVIFFSHGWKTDFGGALDQYGDFLKHFGEELRARPIAGKNLVFVGVIWPSRWMADKPGPRMAREADAASDNEAQAIEALAGDLDEADAQRFYALAAAQTLNDTEASEFARLLLKTKRSLDADEIGTEAGLSEDSVVRLWRDMPSAATSADTDDFDAVGVVNGAAAGPGVAGEEGFDPLNIVRAFSLYQMKDRAGRVGASGVAQLMSELTKRAASVYAVGHSFGAKVVLSAVKGDIGRAVKPRGMLLLQPAISHLCFASDLGDGRSGGYEGVPRAVDGRIFTTFSKWDWPLHEIFHVALRRPADLGEVRTAPAGDPPNKYAALGGYGPRGAAEMRIIDLPDPGAPFAVAGARLVGLNGGLDDKRIDGHMGVANPHCAWALASLIKT